MTDFETRVLAAISDLGRQILELTQLSHTLHNKVDAATHNVAVLAGTVEAMKMELSANSGAIADIGQNLRDHTHE